MRIIAGSLGSSISSRLDLGSSFQDNSQVNFCVLLSLFKFWCLVYLILSTNLKTICLHSLNIHQGNDSLYQKHRFTTISLLKNFISLPIYKPTHIHEITVYLHYNLLPYFSASYIVISSLILFLIFPLLSILKNPKKKHKFHNFIIHEIPNYIEVEQFPVGSV